MDVGGSECQDAYRDISGRATQEAKAEHILEHVLESRVWNGDRERIRTNIGHIRVDSMEGIGRVESGTETEKMSGTYFPDKAEERDRLLLENAYMEICG